MKTYSIYRLGVKKHDFVIEDDDIRRSMSHDNNVSFNVESKDSLDIKIGDYIIEDGSHYTIYDPIDVEESNGVFSYPLVFRSPDYKLKFSIVKDEGATTFPYHGGIKEFVDLVISSLNEDQQEYTAGDIDEGNIIDLEFDNSSCFQALDDICEAANMEWNLTGTSINVKYRIGKDVDVVFEYGKEKGGYSVRLDKVQNTFIATRLIGKGGTVNLPKDYVSPDTPKRLNLGNDILEKNTDKYGKITGVYTNDNIFPRLINKTVLDVTIPEDIEKAVAWKLKLDIPFDLSQQYADDKVPIVKFQTGDLTGSEFEIVDNSWNNTDKTLQIIVQEEEDGYRLPNTSRQPRIGDVFVLLNINMPQSYIDEAEEELRKATQEELNKRSEPQYAPSVKVSKRFLRKKGYSLEIGDSITVKVGDHSINTRILAINQSSSSDEINYELGDEILYSYEDNVNNQIEQIQVTLKQLISLEDVRRLFNILINQWRPLWFDQKLRTYDPVKFNSVTSTDFESKLKGWIIDALGNAEFRDLLIRSFKSWNFAAGPLGAGVGMVNDDELQTDKLLVRKTMYVLEMMIQRMRFQGGIMVLSPATGFKIDRVETFDTYYRVYCRPEDFNEFEVNDQARIQNFNGNNIKYLWSLVLSRGDDYIDISRVDKDGESVPAEGDEIVQLGNRTNPDRQDAVLLSAVNGEVGIFTYYGINSFDLSNKEGSWLGKHGGKKGAVIRGEVHITAGSSGLEQFDEYEDVDKRIQDAKDLADSVQDVVNNLTSIIIPDMQGQIDGSIMSHEGKVPPTLTNEPAVNWTTEEEKNRHIGDYYDYYLTVDGEQVTERYKFSKVNGTYQWVRVADSGSALAASVAREALGLAGTKATITWGNTLPEAPYNINDMWIKLDGSMYICNHQRLDGETGSQSDWQLFNDTMLRLAKMADDNVITKEEKATLRDTWNQIQKEFTAYQAQATKYGVSITALQNAYNTLNTFLTNTVKIAQDIDSNLSVAQKTEYNQDFANYYSERTAFANVIAQKVADESVGNLQIGGINLADYSGGDFLDVLGLYSGDRQYASKTTIDGKACLQYNDGSKNMRFAPVKVENAIYTFSIWVKGSEEYDAQVNHYNGSNYGSTTVHVTTSWERKVITFTAKAGSDIIHFKTKNTIYITDWKYEKGNKATDWSPSIADQNRLSREIAKAEAELAETKANAYADGIVTEAEQNAINEAQARLDALKIGSVNLVSRKMMLNWNNKKDGIAVWGQDSDGIYLAINQGLLYTNVSGGTSRLDCFLGEGKYKANTQYVFSVEWKLAGAQTSNGVSFWATYTDGTNDGIRLDGAKTSLIRESFITAKGKTVEKIFSSYGDNKYRSLIYSLALYEGNKVLAEPPVATEDLQGQSNVNLVDGGKEVTVASSYYSTLKVPVLKPNTVYTVRFTNVEVISGDTPSGYEFRLYDTKISANYATVKIKAGDNHGILITSNNFTVPIEGRLLFYPGIQSEGIIRSVKYTEIMLVEGFTPPSSYSPSPGDVAKDIKDVSDAVSNLDTTINTTFKDGIISEAEAKAIASNINVLNAEKADIDAYYNKLYANTYLTGTAKTNLASAKTAYNTAHTNLINSINTAIADGKATATEKADVDDKFTAYNNALSAYQTRVGEADKAIQDTIKKVADDAQTSANTAQSAANAAQSTANQAQADANAANSKLATWASDNYISPQEKTALRQQKSDIQAEYNDIVANANRYNISSTSYSTAYNSAISALNKYTATSPENIAVSSDYNNIAAYYPARQTILNSIAVAAKAQADKATGAIGMDGGKMLYADPEFKKGTNEIMRYGAQNNGGTVNLYRVSKSTGQDASNSFTTDVAAHVKEGAAGSPHNGSDWCLYIRAYGGTSSSHLGGFYFATPSRANAVFIVKVSAKIPVGYTLKNVHNAHGTDSKHELLTSMAGTGKYETYIFKETCGSTGTFSTMNHLLLSGPVKPGNDPLDPDNAPLEWFVDYVTVFDLTADGYGDIEYNAKDDLAQQLGYSNFDKMVENAAKGETIIKGAYINTKLIDVETLVADTALVDKLIGRELNFTLGSVGGFKMESTLLYSGAKFGTGGAGIAMQSMTNNYGFNVYKDNNNYVEMFQRSSEWGLKGVVNGTLVFQLGGILDNGEWKDNNIIAGWTITNSGFTSKEFTPPTYDDYGIPVSWGSGSKLLSNGGLMISPSGNGILPPSSGLMQAARIAAVGDNAIIYGLEVIASGNGYLKKITALKLSAINNYSTPSKRPSALEIASGDVNIGIGNFMTMKGQLHFDNVISSSASVITLTKDSGHFIHLNPASGNPVVSVSSGLPLGSWFIIAQTSSAGGYYYMKLQGGERFMRRGTSYQQVNAHNQDPSFIFKITSTVWVIGNLPVNWIDWN